MKGLIRRVINCVCAKTHKHMYLLNFGKYHSKNTSQISRCMCSTSSSHPDHQTVEQKCLQIMRRVPQSVALVTSSEYDILHKKWIKRGFTCTSFTSVSLDPAIVSFCIKSPSGMHDLLLESQNFAVHVLSKNQMNLGLHFSKPFKENICQFDGVPHKQNDAGVPLIAGCLAVLECKAHAVHTIGDHHVWYGNVIDASHCVEDVDPLLYWVRQFRTVSDEIFIEKFENATLPFEDWTHKAHLRMAWSYITELGVKSATPIIKQGIKHFNEQNKDKVKFGYHETITLFYIAIVADAIYKQTSPSTFEDFLTKNIYLMNKDLISKYYSRSLLFSDLARYSFVEPDLQPLPC